MEWTSDPRFRSSRRVFFSFIFSNVNHIKNGILKWDPEMKAGFKDEPQVLNLKKESQAESSKLPSKDPRDHIELPSFMQLRGAPSSSTAARSPSLVAMLMAVVVATALTGLQHLHL